MSTRTSPGIAVALHWDGNAAPRVTAKGRGELAHSIIECAREHGVPLDEDPELVELLATVDIGSTIPESLFVAVAEVIAFAYSLRAELPAHLTRAGHDTGA